MAWEKFARTRRSLLSVVILGVATFFLGVWCNQLLNKKLLSDLEKILLPTTLTTVTGGLLKFANVQISNEVEQEINLELNAREEEWNMRKEDSGIFFGEMFLDQVADLRDTVESAGIPQENLDRILQKFDEIKAGESRFEFHVRLSRKIVEWFNEKGKINKFALRDEALKAASAGDLQQPIRTAFDEDIRECIHWIRCSIDELHPFNVTSERYMSAMKHHIPGGYDRYKTALTTIQKYIEKQECFKDLLGAGSILEKMIAHLLEELQFIADNEY